MLSNRQSIRLKGYDYSQSGLYFVTICSENREHIFGHIVGADPCVRPSIDPCVRPSMDLNDCGKIIKKWLNKIPNKFNVVLDEYQIMPNHIHMIIQIVSNNGSTRGSNGNGSTRGSTPTIGTIIQWFKTMVTNEYIQNVYEKKWKSFDKRLFQRNYYEHIIHNETELNQIREYIQQNPLMWERDRNNPDCKLIAQIK